ncbi:MAG TPA: hypothetical protein PKD16_18585 [Saprospiraceae bacterium]|jgi:hypothetical protein|nr:hypothetical protein [Saprospiraceae bacterium]HMT72184.1 hypothetical protein [Saprospiraceae bacterium]
MQSSRIYYILLLLLLFACRSKKIASVEGIYINSNYNYEPFLAEVPYVSDTLILKKDNTFKSGYFGNGTYIINDSKIRLSYLYEFGVANFEAQIEAKRGNIDKIILFKNQNHHYKRIK